jgi:TusE/DsrC/DsvC family sulfur relay protein
MQMADIDDEGYLIDPLEWNDRLAEELSRQEGIELTTDHWTVIRFMRNYYAEHQVSPDVRHVTKHLAERISGDTRKLLFDLFPYGYVKQACRIAGMKRPRGWSTG